ncbi:MAG: divergent polysaccharide deacetylase family protein [Candidatus Omnitrophota bacterium]
MRKKRTRNLVVVIAAVIFFILIFGPIAFFSRGGALDKLVSGELAKSEISKGDLIAKSRCAYTEKRYWAGDSFSPEDFEKSLGRKLNKAGFRLLPVLKSTTESVSDGKKELRQEISYPISKRSSRQPLFYLTLIRKVSPPPKTSAVTIQEKTPVVAIADKRKPRAAVVLDDWGYNLKNLDAVLKLNKPVTLSVLPGLTYSAVVAKKAMDNGIEVILHMPMEPKSKIKLEPTTILFSMSDDEIRDIFSEALATVPGARGVSNHEGSKITEDERSIRALFGEIKNKDMFFLDSVVTSKTVCERVARQIGIKFAKRSVFLDNDSDAAYIKGQFEQLISAALKTGSAIGIGHDRPNTIAVFKDMIPEFEANGIELTHLSNCVE